jgi:hypothetical protein
VSLHILSNAVLIRRFGAVFKEKYHVQSENDVARSLVESDIFGYSIYLLNRHFALRYVDIQTVHLAEAIGCMPAKRLMIHSLKGKFNLSSEASHFTSRWELPQGF